MREPRLRAARCNVPGHAGWDKALLKRSSNSEEAEVSEGFPEPPRPPDSPEDLVPVGAGLT